MLRVDGVGVDFEQHRALDGVDLVADSGEIVVVLGPSGCGKSTLLRVIAGLLHPDRGHVAWNDDDLAGVEPHRRDFGLMFQDHTLFPHQDVATNIGFGLRMRGVKANERRARVSQLLDLVGLDGYGARRVDTLSGGEAQRVALARAVAPRPRLLMLDEPLGSLDRELRHRLIDELRSVLEQLGPATIHVTHDHDEAFALADRLAIMASGRIQRVGPPAEVWNDPRTESVARFLGHRNIVDVDERGVTALGVLRTPAGRALVRADGFWATTGDPDVNVEVTGCRFAGERFAVEAVTLPGRSPLTLSWPTAVAAGTILALRVDPTAVASLDR